MLHRPFSIVGTVYLIGVIVPALAAVWLHINGSESIEGFDPAIVALGLLSTVIGWGIWKVRPWGYYSYLASLGFVGICLFFQYNEVPTLTDFAVFLGFAVFMMTSSFFLQMHVHAPYFNPNFSWGRRDPRFQVEVNIRFEVNGEACVGGLYDISKGGCFVALDRSLNSGENIELRMRLENNDFTVPAKVVRMGDDPKGYGLMFTQMNRDRRRLLQNIIVCLRADQRHQAA